MQGSEAASLQQQLHVLGVDIAEARQHPSHHLQQTVASIVAALDAQDVSPAGLLATITSHILLQHQLEDINVHTACCYASGTHPHYRRR